MTATVHGTAALAAGRGERPTPLQRLRSYLALTKPRIIELLLVTTVPAMVLAAHGVPSLWRLAATLVGGSLSAGSANALNCYLDRDIDVVMHRTERRPLARHTVAPRNALIFGLVLAAVSTGLFLGLVNPLSALLSVAAILGYVVGYTMLLKRNTSQNIVWGGAAGCMPTLIGWSAVTGHLAWSALILFGIVFLWTPPHFWALAMRFRDDYARAGVPMLPVVAPALTVADWIVAYTWATVAVSLLLWPVADTGPLYPAVAAAAGVWFALRAHRLRHRIARDLPARPVQLFHDSITYLTVVFVALAVDVLIFH